MRRLPDYMVIVEQIDDDYLAVAAHEHLGAYYWTKFALADIPEHLARMEDLIGFVLHTIDLRSISEPEQFGAFGGVQSAIHVPPGRDPLELNDGHFAAVGR